MLYTLYIKLLLHTWPAFYNTDTVWSAKLEKHMCKIYIKYPKQVDFFGASKMIAIFVVVIVLRHTGISEFDRENLSCQTFHLYIS